MDVQDRDTKKIVFETTQSARLDSRVAVIYGITGIEANTDYSVLHTGNTELPVCNTEFFPVIKIIICKNVYNYNQENIFF